MAKILELHKGTKLGRVRLGSSELECAVLENGVRVLSQRTFSKAMGTPSGGSAFKRRLQEGVADLPVFMAYERLKPFIDDDLKASLSSPIEYIPKHGGRSALGIKAELVPDVCDVWLKARDAGVLTANQRKIAKHADILIRGLAHVGIAALVDEATDYQPIRDKEALQQILDKYLQKEFAAWAKRFPDEFYKEMFRLRGWQWRGMRVNRPSVVGKYTNDLVYQRLAPGILDELQKRNPKDDHGKREGKHHQLLTGDIGIPALQNHLFATTGFMRASATWDQFYRSMQRAFPKLNSNLVFNFPEPEEENSSVQ
ncbi:MAG: P63C domain-containing protein [Acidobacteriia bacterium]|nr:P63C domain-containing protein [Terriglobia bacterium]